MTRARAALFASLLATSMSLPANAAQKGGAQRNKVLATKDSAKKVTPGQQLAAKKTGNKVVTKKAPKQNKIIIAAADVKAPAADNTAAPAVVEGTQPAEAQASVAAPKQRGLGMRILGGIGHAGAVAGRSVGRFLGRQFQMREEMKEHLGAAKQLRKMGELTAAAEVLRDAPKAEGMWERFRAWRGKKSVLRLARRDLKAKRLDSDPAEGFATIATLNDAHMTSWIDRLRANRALKKGVVNSVRTAQRLGNKGRYEEAYEKIEWSLGERETIDQRTADVVQRLYTQAMKSSDRAAIRFMKAHSPMDKQRMFREAIGAMNMAHTFAEIASAATQTEIFDQAHAGKIAQRMGLDQDGLNKAVNQIAMEQAGHMPGGIVQQEAGAEQVATAQAEPVESKLDTTKGNEK